MGKERKEFCWGMKVKILSDHKSAELRSDNFRISLVGEIAKIMGPESCFFGVRWLRFSTGQVLCFDSSEFEVV